MAQDDQERLNFILKEIGIGPKALADKLGIPVHKITGIKIGKVKISPEIALLIENQYNFDFKWLLTGVGEPHLKFETEEIKVPSQVENNKVHGQENGELQANVVEIEHNNIIRQFIDKSFARDINKELVKIERMDSSQFRELGAYIKGISRGLERCSTSYKSYDRRKSERRLQEDQDKIPNGKDRRATQDRRKASTGN